MAVCLHAQLIALNANLQAQGPLFAYIRDSFGISDRQLQQIIANTALATQILSDTCNRGELAFDVDAEAFLVTGTVTPATLACGS